MSAAALLPAVAASGYGRIPVLDIGPYLACDPGAAAPLARACEYTGFLVVANHGVPPRLARTSRYAIPFFLGPNHDAVVDCVPTCVGPDNPVRYEPTTYGAFTQRLLTLNFAHRRADGGGGEYA
jgi:isopenicillin N synthase-like dioxygenase